MKDFRDKWVLVTGAGSGIGRETAVAFARKGARLLLVDINDEGCDATRELIESEGGKAWCFHADVSDEHSMHDLAAAVHKRTPALDILVNNAGIGSGGRFLDTSLQTWRRVMDINLMGVVHGCHFFLPKMVERGQGGHVVNLASAAAFLAAPEMPVYASSKFAVLGLSESLRADMARHGIGVTAVCPGFINTPIVANTILEGDMGADAGVRDKIVRFYEKRNYTPRQVAEAILDAVRGNDGVRPVSPESWAMYYSKRFAPGLMGWLSRRGSPFSQ